MVGPYSSASQQQYSQNGSTPLRNGSTPMDNRPTAGEYPPAALASNSYPGYSSSTIDSHNGEQSASPHPQQQSAPQDARSTYSNSATPTSETSAIYSARAPTFPADQLVGTRYVDNGHRYTPTSTSSGGMVLNLATAAPSAIKPEPKESEDPTLAAPSPSGYASPAHYATHYPGPHTMSADGYPHPGAPPTQTWRQDWSSYGAQPHQMASPYGPHSPSPTAMAAAPPGMVSTARPVSASKANRKRAGDQPSGHPLSQVYSFVPIPGAQQNKRPRRRYEEIERMYKCGWNGCEKAYGTLNHLNAHVTMQGHGTKRTPEEFKEIRKEWKARKKEEEAQRKAAEEEARRRAQEEAASIATTTTAEPHATVTASSGSVQYTSGVGQQRQLPPLSYAQHPSISSGSTGSVQYTTSAGAPTAPMDNIPQYGQPQMYTGYAPSQYSGQPGQIYASQQPQRPAPPQSNGNTNSSTSGAKPNAPYEYDN